MVSLTTQEEREYLRKLVDDKEIVFYCPEDALGPCPPRRIVRVDLSSPDPREHKAYFNKIAAANLYNTPLWMYKRVVPIKLEN